MRIDGSVALVTGANRGLGAAFCRVLLEHGAAKVYAAARNPDAVSTPGVIPVQLDITRPDEVSAVAARCGDVTLLVNNAGILTGGSALSEDAVENGRLEFETNVLGPLAMSRAFAPILRANGGGVIVNVLSVLSWFSSPNAAMYCAAKSASWSLTNSLRQELAAQHTNVVALHVGYMDTDMTASVNGPKSDPDHVAAQALAGVEADAPEVLADDASRRVKAALSGDLTTLYPGLAARSDTGS